MFRGGAGTVHAHVRRKTSP